MLRRRSKSRMVTPKAGMITTSSGVTGEKSNSPLELARRVIPMSRSFSFT